MNLAEIKTAINRRISENGGTVYAEETEEGYAKPAVFVEIMPIGVTRISSVYEEVELGVKLHCEPEAETGEACLKLSEEITRWFAEPVPVGDRVLKPPEHIRYTTEFGSVLEVEFILAVTRLHNPNGYTDADAFMEDAELEFRITE